MGLTYTRGQDLQKIRTRRASITIGERLLLLTSITIVLAVVLAYAGRIRAEAWSDANRPAPLNLNALPGADGDRRTRTRRECGRIRTSAREGVHDAGGTTGGGQGRDGCRVRESGGQRTGGGPVAHRTPLPNVGALAKIADTDGSQRPLFTPAQLAALKPYLSVRTPEEFRSSVLWCTLAIVVGFHLVSLIWRWRGMPGDRVLLALAHLLVGIGFVMMLSRPDPLRDTLAHLSLYRGSRRRARACSPRSR